jgi:hypothetical protein
VKDYPWVSYQDWNENHPHSNITPASVSLSYPNTSYTNGTSEAFAQQASTCKCEIKDLTASKLQASLFLSPLHLHKLTMIQKRREQNRTSQQKFRERTRKEYEALEQALEAERQRTWNSLILNLPKSDFCAI